jgi:hypothetical protein
MPLQEIECVGVQLEAALQVCLEHEGVGALGGGKGPSIVFAATDTERFRAFHHPPSGEILDDKVD